MCHASLAPEAAAFCPASLDISRCPLPTVSVGSLFWKRVLDRSVCSLQPRSGFGTGRLRLAGLKATVETSAVDNQKADGSACSQRTLSDIASDLELQGVQV